MTQPPEAPRTDPKPQHATFFRQSGWLMTASIVGGAMAWAVHFLSKKIPNAEYSQFGALMMVNAVLPTMPLQMVFAQQTASALASNRERQLAGMIRVAWLWLFILWLVAAGAVLIFQQPIMARWHLDSPAVLWITLFTILASLLSPMLGGVLQGKQDFFWIGWLGILGSAGRIGGAALLVLAFGMGAAGMMTGTLAGMLVGVCLAVWLTRDLWSLKREPFDGKNLLKQILPLALGFGAYQFLFTSDTIYATAFFNGDETAPYVATGTLSRAMLWLVMPLASVMFPKIVHSSVRSEKNTLMKIVLPGTAVLAVCSGLGLCVAGPWAVKFVGKAEWVEEAKALLPWYAAAMVPLALANVWVNDFLARGRFRIVPFLLALAVAYGFALPFILNHYPKKLEHILQTLAAFNVLLLCICALTAFAERKMETPAPAQQA